MLSPDQLELRKTGIGGSDIAAIMGISPWNTAYGIYLDKIGESKPLDKPHLQLGHKAQGPILRLYEKQTESVVEKEEIKIIHPHYPFLYGHIDGVTNEGKTFIEVKTTSLGIEEWDYTIPPYYRTQVGFYAALGNPDYVDMAVAYWFNEKQLDNIKYFTTLTYWRDLAFEQGIIDLAVEFWQEHVLKRRPPELRTLDDIKKRYAISLDDSSITADENIKNKLINLERIQHEKDDLDQQEEALRFDIQNFMGNNAFLLDEEGKKVVSFKSHTRNSFDTSNFKQDHPDLYQSYIKPSSSRPFKII